MKKNVKNMFSSSKAFSNDYFFKVLEEIYTRTFSVVSRSHVNIEDSANLALRLHDLLEKLQLVKRVLNRQMSIK